MLKVLERFGKTKVHFLHIGKTGGSAIKAVLSKNPVTAKFLLTIHEHHVSLKNIPSGELVVFFLRDPISRFVSGFYSRQRKGQPRYYSEWNAEEQLIFSTFHTPNQLACALADGSHEHHLLALAAMQHVEHLLPFKKWYGDLDYFRSRVDDVLFIGFQESLDSDFLRLKSLLRLPDTSALPDDDVAAHRNPVKLNKTIEEVGLQALRHWYAEDFFFISFCRELMTQRRLNAF